MSNKLFLSAWQWLLLILLAVVAIYATERLVEHERQVARSQQLRHEIASAGQLRALIESELNIPLYLTIGLTAHVQARNGDISPAEMHLLLPELAHQARHIRNIGVAPANTLRYVYPLIGNEQAIGIYYPDLKEQWPDIAAIITQREARLVGPISLIQGGTAFIYRLPVYLNADNYWGIISTVVDIESVWSLLQRQTTEQGVQVAIRSLNSAGKAGPAFYGDERLFYDDSMLLAISLRGALWQMAVRSLSPVSERSAEIRWAAYSVTALLLALLAWLFMSRQHLRKSVVAQQRDKVYLRTIMDNVTDAVITTNAEGIIEQVNRSCYPMFGYTGTSLPGQHWSVLLAEPQYVDEVYSATSTTKAEYETGGRRRDNSIFPLSVSRSNIRLHQQPRQLLVLRDLSERQKNEQLKQEFISTVSHELRTPLTSISGALGLAVGGALGELNASQLRMLQLAQSHCQQLNKLVNTLLDVEKLTSGNMLLQLEPLQLLDVVQQAIDEAQVIAQQHRTQLRLDCPEALQQAVVRVDAGRLKQVVLHLLNNALKFSPADSSVTVQVLQQQKFIRIAIHDQGKGVEQDFVPRLFSRFSQADSSDSREYSGTGLGLAVSRHLMQNMHGDIGYTPGQQRGSCFYLDLPFDAAIQPVTLP
ncbi:ATP-binding protein [Rheinheimera maricola]|uniref:histidine kinase n=1 Tax=Rheinheimera maricola TaxID=2793282 RepID=A0ABS7XFE3_9GAMM|nr:ATP-binding protein [Rheinheimera maricola]MBZ9613844.1 PAS domain S-box protein [Rheinheimera maricola]